MVVQLAVSVWYHVGSRHEVPGRTGFAHLFEHLMFKGSAHHPEGYFEALSVDSKRSLALQGGVFTPAEAAAFIAQPYAADAVEVRLWDDLAKLPAAVTPPLAHYVPILETAQRTVPAPPAIAMPPITQAATTSSSNPPAMST